MRRWWPKRQPNYGAVVAATVRETTEPEYERRLGDIREQLARLTRYEAPTVTPPQPPRHL